MPVTLDQLGDVLTDDDLIRLMQWTPRTLRSLRAQERRTHLAVLPPRLPITGRARYLRDDVRVWLRGRQRRTA